MRCTRLLALFLAAVSTPRASAGEGAADLGPRLERRVAVEDEPLVFEVALPVGQPVSRTLRVGDPALSYRFTWALGEVGGGVLRTRTATVSQPRDRWETVTVVEPYEPDFEGQLELRVAVEYLRGGATVSAGASRFPIRRLRDITPPLEASHGDEEGYQPFEGAPIDLSPGTILTTTDRLTAPGGATSSRSPFRAILDDGDQLEPASGEQGTPGTLGLRWANVFDNLGPPFSGELPSGISRFGVYYRPRWDLGGSHHLVSDPESPYMASERVPVEVEGDSFVAHFVELTGDLPDPPAAGGAYGSGEVSIPLPYDRVGELEVGFLAEDAAWPSPNQAVVGRFRYQVIDDIAPVLLFSLRREKGGEATWASLDSVNRRWAPAVTALGLPESFPEGPAEEAEPLELKVRTPYIFQLMGFENTRLERRGLQVELVGPPGTSGFGIRTHEGGGRSLSWRVPVDGFDPGLVRTSRGDPPALFFGLPGAYALELQARDIHGNERVLRIPLAVGEQEFDRVRLRQAGRRGGTRKRGRR